MNPQTDRKKDGNYPEFTANLQLTKQLCSHNVTAKAKLMTDADLVIKSQATQAQSDHEGKHGRQIESC